VREVHLRATNAPAAPPVDTSRAVSPRDAAPAPYRVRLAARHESPLRDGIFYLYLVLAAPYLVWRLSIVNWGAWFGPIVYLAEFYGVITTLLFLWMARRMFYPVFRQAAHQRTVDVLICTYRESLDVLTPTVVGALRVRGVRNVWVLDDGARPEVAEMVRQLGACYRQRVSNEHAKAGNLNSGLRHTDAELLLVLDADHVPLPHFLERTAGYFDDSNVAFVQTPQTYHNGGGFLSRNVRRRPWTEQGMFYDCIQVAKNRWNAAFFVGTSALLRRSALDEIGGFATGTATEDIHTSLRLHGHGWTSLFVPEALAFGLEAESLREFYRQRRRWAAGSLGLLTRSADSPLWRRGLTWAQRLNYLSSTLAHLQGLQRLTFFFTPVVCTVSLVAPVTGRLSTFLFVFGAFLSATFAATLVLARGTYHPLHTEAHALVNSFAHVGGLGGVVRVQRKFAVSRKSGRRYEPTWVRGALWTLVLVALLSAARDAQLLLQDSGPRALLAASLVVVVINLGLLCSFLLPLRKYERDRRAATSQRGISVTERYWHVLRVAARPRPPLRDVSGALAVIALIPLAALALALGSWTWSPVVAPYFTNDATATSRVDLARLPGLSSLRGHALKDARARRTRVSSARQRSLRLASPAPRSSAQFIPIP